MTILPYTALLIEIRPLLFISEKIMITVSEMLKLCCVFETILRIIIDTFVDSKRKHGASIFAAVIIYFVDFHLFCLCFCITNKEVASWCR